MIGLIFGIIFILGGIIGGVLLSRFESKTYYIEDAQGNRKYFDNPNNIYGYDNKFKTEKTRPLAKWAVFVICGCVILGLLWTFLGCTVSVETGNTGVVTTFGKVEDFTYEAGFHLKAPWNSVTEMDNRVQKANAQLSCFSSDIQEVTMSYTLNYQIDKENAQEIYRSIGSDYYSTIIEPNIAECVKIATANYTAERLVQDRSELANKIEDLLTQALATYHINVSTTAIEDMDFTDAFTNAVESKQVAEQKKKQAIIEQEQALAQAENEKKIKTVEAEAAAEVATTKANADAEVAKIAAEAEAEVVKIQAEAAEYQGKKEAAIAMQRLAAINGWSVAVDETTGLIKLLKTDGTEVTDAERAIGVEKLMQYYYTEAWDGKLPETYVSGDDASTLILGN